MPSDTGAIALPSSIDHLGVVVKDIDKTIEFLSSMWGLGPWQSLEYSPHKDEIIVGEPFKIKIACAKLGPVVLELIQPLEGRSLWSQFLETKGEGLQHVAFNLSNWDEMVSKLRERGSKMVAGGVFGGKRWCYFDTKPGGIIVDFMDNFGFMEEEK
ncbi:MAG: VOC family protein [Dehalococcoidia bacterium]|nr:MAG: VOC family protein [Dehalococcoidia bacterium]